MPFSCTYVSGCQHVLRVNESSEQSHQLYCSTQFWVRVTNHLLDHYIYQQNVLLKKKILPKNSQSTEKFNKASYTTEHLNQPINYCSPETTVLECNATFMSFCKFNSDKASCQTHKQDYRHHFTCLHHQSAAVPAWQILWPWRGWIPPGMRRCL